jgi:hypothetical protein
LPSFDFGKFEVISVISPHGISMFLKFFFGLGGHHMAFFVMKYFCCLADFENLPIHIINVIYCIQIFLTPNVGPRKVRVLYVGIQALMGCSGFSRFFYVV